MQNGETFRRSVQLDYFDGEEDIKDKWEELKKAEKNE